MAESSAAADPPLSLPTFAELLSCLPPDAFHVSSPHYRQLSKALQQPAALRWLAGTEVVVDAWLSSPTSDVSEGEEGVAALLSHSLRLSSLCALLWSLPIGALIRLRRLLPTSVFRAERSVQSQPPAASTEAPRFSLVGSPPQPPPSAPHRRCRSSLAPSSFPGSPPPAVSSCGLRGAS